MRKFLSIALTICIVLSALVIPLSIVASTAFTDFTLDFEENYLNAEGNAYYVSDSNSLNLSWTRGARASIIKEADGNNAMRLTYDSNENYKCNVATNIYEPSTKARFTGENKKTYVISFDYKVEKTDDKKMQLYIVHCGRYASKNDSLAGTDLNFNQDALYTTSFTPTPIGPEISAASTGYVNISAEYTANTTDCPLIILSTNNSTAVAQKTDASEYASVLIDNIKVELKSEPVIDDTKYPLDFSEDYKYEDDTLFYNSDNAKNWTNSGRGSAAEMATEDDGNRAVRLTYDAGNGGENYKANPAMSIYNPATKDRFAGTVGKRYLISFDYKVEETDGRTMQLYVVHCGRFKNLNLNLGDTDFNFNTAALQVSSVNTIEASSVITEKGDKYKRVSVVYTACENEWPVITLSTNGTVKATDIGANGYASILIDNISVVEEGLVKKMFRNYDGTDKEIEINLLATFEQLEIPRRDGYIFGGYYLDAEMKQSAPSDAMVVEQENIYVKWLGDGTAVSPQPVESTELANIMAPGINTLDLSNVTCRNNSILEQPLVNQYNIVNWYGSKVFTATDSQSVGSANFTLHPGTLVDYADSVIFYAELPDFKAVGEDSGLALQSGTNTTNVLLLQQKETESYFWANTGSVIKNAFDYLSIGSEEWVSSDIDENNNFVLPTGFKGYIRLNFDNFSFNADSSGRELDFDKEVILATIHLIFKGISEKSGQAVYGGALYIPNEKSDSTIISYKGTPYQLAKADNSVLVPEEVNKNENTFDIRHNGTIGDVNVKKSENTETSAFWSENPVGITSVSGEANTTKGYMNTYNFTNLNLTMQPAVDSFAIYVEMPNYSSNLCGLKLVDAEIVQTIYSANVSYSNSIYEYMSIDSGIWKKARADADGGLTDIPSGFKGYIRFDIKQFKGFSGVENFDFTKLYKIKSLKFGINHVGGENGDMIIGGLYAIIKNSDNTLLKNSVNGEVLSAFSIESDINCDGNISNVDSEALRSSLLGKAELSPAAMLRAEKASSTGKCDITALFHTKAILAGTIKPDETKESSKIIIGEDIFSSDIGDSSVIKTHDRVKLEESSAAAVIKADTALNSNDKAIAFANEINSNKVADFEKMGIDQMCHVSTFMYSQGNIYVSYYANTINGNESANCQVARLAYCPEDKPEEKVILDIQIVGDDLYGHKVTGVYDTIFMKPYEDSDDLYILWTASIDGKYYRLYRIFNMATETLGEVQVNRFKVGNTVNDFSSSGMIAAMAENNIGYKEFFSDIGIMQKQSWRKEGNDYYCYTGAYSGNFTCIIKSKDLITWEYVAQPDEGENGTGFQSESLWENAVYVLNDKVYYFVRQWGTNDGGSEYGILTYYDLLTGEWAKPVLVGDTQSRSDFIMYNGSLYLFHAPTDRNHIGILKIDTENLANTQVVLQANMNGSCFYPFVQYTSDGELAMSYTVDRKHIRLAKFTLSNYLY